MTKKEINCQLDSIDQMASVCSGCLVRHYGARIIREYPHINEWKIISTGFNNSPEGTKSCKILNTCARKEMSIPRGTRYELCRSVHAEQECIIQASKKDLEGSTLLLVGKEADGKYVKNPEPCIICKKMIINAGISKVIVRVTKTTYKEYNVKDWIIDDILSVDTYANSSK